MSLIDRISVDPAIRFGKPCVRGTRITVGDVLGYLAGGMSENQGRRRLSTVDERRHPSVHGLCGRTRAPDDGYSCGLILRLPFDEQLAEALCVQLHDVFPGSLHVRTIEGPSVSDERVWTLAVERDWYW